MTERKAGHISLTSDTYIAGSTQEGGVLAHDDHDHAVRIDKLLFIVMNARIQ